MYSKIDEYVTHLIRVSSPERTAWNIERMRDNVPPNWNYIDGCMMVALLSMSDITGDPRYADFAESFIDAFVWMTSTRDASFSGCMKKPESTNTAWPQTA